MAVPWICSLVSPVAFLIMERIPRRHHLYRIIRSLLNTIPHHLLLHRISSLLMVVWVLVLLRVKVIVLIGSDTVQILWIRSQNTHVFTLSLHSNNKVVEIMTPAADNWMRMIKWMVLIKTWMTIITVIIIRLFSMECNQMQMAEEI